MTRARLDSRTLWSILWLVSVGMLLGGCQAPRDYYLEFAKMERLGQELSSPQSREPLSPDPLLRAFEPEDQPSVLLRLEMRPGGSTDMESLTSGRLFRERVPVSVRLDAVKRTLSDQGIMVTGVRAVDGRLEGGENVVRVTFVPQALSEEAIEADYLMVLAVVRGADSPEGTVDQVVGVAEDAAANPQMILEGAMQDYIDYVERGILSQEEWLSRVHIRRFME